MDYRCSFKYNALFRTYRVIVFKNYSYSFILQHYSGVGYDLQVAVYFKSP